MAKIVIKMAHFKISSDTLNESTPTPTVLCITMYLWRHNQTLNCIKHTLHYQVHVPGLFFILRLNYIGEHDFEPNCGVLVYTE